MSQKRIQVIGNHLAYKSDLPIYPLESSKKVLEDNDVVIVGYSRTPIGSFNGSLSSLSAVSLGATSIKKSVSMSGLQLKDVDGVYMGNVLQANEGQAPARQAALEAGLSNTTPSTTINKVCASGMKAIMLGAQDIICGTHDIVVSGGMESMSNVPYYLPKARNGLRMGDGEVVDGLMKDGLKDAYAHHAMGVIAESTAKEYNISRKEQVFLQAE